MKRHFASRISGALLTAVIGVTLLAAMPASAQTGVIAFRDDCNGLLYAMRANGTGRVVLPFPPLPLPTDRYVSPLVLDVTTSGPLTVVYSIRTSRNVIIGGQPRSVLVDYGLFAVQVNDVGGTLTPDPLVRLSLPETLEANPNLARNGAFSAGGDRLAVVALPNPDPESPAPNVAVLMTAHVERDASLRIIGLSDLVAVGDLLLIGVPDAKFPSASGFTGYIDYFLDGNSIVASIYLDLWRIHLGADHRFLSSELLTDNTEGFAEWNPAVSPDGSHVAYTGGIFRGPGVRETHIYSLDVSSGIASPVTTNKNKDGAASNRNSPMWSPDSRSIGFTAFTSRTPRGSPCPAVNTEIFLIAADGSAAATKITDTNGTSAEAWSRWGW